MELQKGQRGVSKAAEHPTGDAEQWGEDPRPAARACSLVGIGKTHTYPTDSARALVESSDTKTWQANRWSAGCLVMNPKYLWKRGVRGAELNPPLQHGSRPPNTPLYLSPPLTCCSLDGSHKKRCSSAGKSGYIYSPTGGRGKQECGHPGRRGRSTPTRHGKFSGRAGGLRKERASSEVVTLASWESSALTPIFTPLTLISRTQLEGGLKCTVSRRVVAIWGRDRDTLGAICPPTSLS